MDLNKIAEITKNCELFRKIVDEQGNDKIHIACCKAMKLIVFNPGQVIISFGEPASDFFVVLEGKVSVKIPSNKSRSPRLEDPKHENKKRISGFFGSNEKQIGMVLLSKFLNPEPYEEVKILTTGDVFGELALLNDKPRAATVTAKSKTLLGILSKESFHRLLAHHAERSINEKIDFLQSLPIFKSWSRNYLIKVSFYFTLKKVSWNQVLYRAGSSCSWIFFIKAGDIMVIFKQLTQSINPENKKSFNKHFKMFAQQVDLKLVKKSKGMILGIEEVLAGDKVMRHTAKCTSASAEVFVLSKHVRSRQDFNLRVMKPEFVNAIKDNYLDNNEFLQRRFQSSCLTERAKIQLDGFQKFRKKKKIVKNEEDFRKFSGFDLGCARILYSNRRTGSVEFGCETERNKHTSVFESQSNVDMGRRVVTEGIFRNTVVLDDL
jgi:CRP-like cAMP-binding protein